MAAQVILLIYCNIVNRVSENEILSCFNFMFCTLIDNGIEVCHLLNSDPVVGAMLGTFFFFF